MIRNYIRSVLPVIFFICLTAPAALSQKVDPRIPTYTIPYVLPKVDSIKLACKRIFDYVSHTSERKVIDQSTGSEITDLSVPNKNAAVSKGFAGEWSYTLGVFISAIERLTEITGDNSWFDFDVKYFDYVFTNLPFFRKNASMYGEKAAGWRSIIYMRALDDCGSMGCSLIKTYMKTKDQRYRPLIDTIADFISNKQFRLKDKTLARQRPQEASVWADDLYMSVPFLAQMGRLTGDKKCYDDAVRQVLQINNLLFVKEKGIIDHGWSVTSADYDPHFFWGRANGWNLMAMAELLSVLPHNHPGRPLILHLYRTIVQSLANYQDGTGFWHNMLDKNDTFLETSCTAMFVYAIARGINEGWINHVYGPVAQIGWNALATRILPNGQVDGTVEATTFAHDNAYYYNRGKSVYATHGYGPVLYAGAEMIRLLQNPNIVIEGNPTPTSINATFHYKLKKK